MNNIIPLFLVGGGIIIALFTLVWIIQLSTKNAAIVDTLWAISFPVLALVYFSMAHGFVLRQLLVLVTVCLWGGRLGMHLFRRTMGHPEDARYTSLRKEWGVKQNIMMLRFFYFQAILALLLSYPFAIILSNETAGLSAFEIAGAVIWLIGFIGESVADNQLRKFKADPANKGKVCDTGLWNYSRHPNYFFEWVIWVSFFLMAMGSPYGYISIICPVLMYIFLTKVTGIKYTEDQMVKSKGQAFIEYQKTTSAFVPLPKRKNTEVKPSSTI